MIVQPHFDVLFKQFDEAETMNEKLIEQALPYHSLGNFVFEMYLLTMKGLLTYSVIEYIIYGPIRSLQIHLFKPTNQLGVKQLI